MEVKFTTIQALVFVSLCEKKQTIFVSLSEKNYLLSESFFARNLLRR